MHRILFVDDEPKILTGLRRMLHSQRREWEMEFAEGGVEAIKRLQAGPFDVVVSDARMPGMEGAELLEEVRCKYPDTVRIILSGQCSRDSVLQCVGVAHQFLSKPCDAEFLKAVITRVCSRRDCILDGEARTAVSRVSSLPSQSGLYSSLVDLTAVETASVQTLSEMIGADVAMSMKVVQLVSSGFFGSPQRVIDVPRAVELLGAETIRVLAALPGVFRPRQPDEFDEVFLCDVNEHCLTVAEAAKRVAQSATGDRKTAAHACVAGMFHEVGPLIRPSRAAPPRELEDPDDAKGSRSAIFHDSLAGAYLAALWGLPAEVVEIIAGLHDPTQSEDRAFTALTAVHVAHACLHDRRRRSDGVESGELDVDYLRRIHCADRLNEWREICRETELNEVLP